MPAWDHSHSLAGHTDAGMQCTASTLFVHVCASDKLKIIMAMLGRLEACIV